MTTIEKSDDSNDASAQLHPLWFILLCVIWIFSGLFGHGPWKPDEAYSFGLVYHMVQTGDWVVPTLGGEPFMEKPPIFFIVAAIFAKLFSGWLPLHDGAHIATAFFFGLACLFTVLTARQLNEKSDGSFTILILLGCVGLLPRAHQLITDTALLCGFSMAYYAFAISIKRPQLAGLLLGTGVGIGFMSKGLLAPGMLGIIAITLPIVNREWRNFRYGICLGISLLAMLPWLTIWPWLLYQRGPVLFQEWFYVQNWGRFFGSARLSSPNEDPIFYLKLLSWHGWPATPLAIFALWCNRKTIFSSPTILLPLVCCLAIVAVLTTAGEGRELYILPALIPLALLATNGEDLLKRIWFWLPQAFFTTIFLLLSFGIWFGWFILLMMQQTPEGLQKVQESLRLPAAYPFSSNLFIAAIAITLFCSILFYASRQDSRRSIIRWTTSITLLWGLAMTICLPIIDEKKSYERMIGELYRAMPTTYNCVASKGLGEPQRGLLEYYRGLITKRVENKQGDECELLLVQSDVFDKWVPDNRYRKIWQGNRPDDNSERFWLYQRARTP